jgi:hypothetical protein
VLNLISGNNSGFLPCLKFFSSRFLFFLVPETMSEAAQAIAAKITSLDEQRELFLWKYRDIPRTEVNEMLKVTLFFSKIHIVKLFIYGLLCRNSKDTI